MTLPSLFGGNFRALTRLAKSIDCLLKMTINGIWSRRNTGAPPDHLGSMRVSLKPQLLRWIYRWIHLNPIWHSQKPERVKRWRNKRLEISKGRDWHSMWVNTVGASFRTTEAAGGKIPAQRHFGRLCEESKTHYQTRQGINLCEVTSIQRK